MTMRLLKVPETASLLRLSISAVYALVDQGKLAAYRVGPRQGGVRISEEDVAAYLASCRTPAGQPCRSRQQVKLKRL